MGSAGLAWTSTSIPVDLTTDWDGEESHQIMSRSESADAEESASEGNDAAFQHDRQQNDQRLKDRFEQIFEKYARDFTGVGDEIDIETGEIVVDNGHLENMQHEVDPGESQSLQFVKDFADELEHEVEYSESEEEGGSDGPAGESYAEGMESEGHHEATAAPDNHSSMRLPYHLNDPTGQPKNTALFALDPLLQELSHATLPAEIAQYSRNTSGVKGSLPGEGETQPAALSDIMSIPAVQSSMRNLMSRAESDRNLAPEAIEALGVSIANQLARLMPGGGRSEAKVAKGKRKDPTWDFPDLPAFKRQRIASSQPPRPQLSQLSTVLSPAGKSRKEPSESIWAPAHHPRCQKPKPPKLPISQGEQKDYVERSDVAVASESARQQADDPPVDDGVPVLKECHHCGIRATVIWRSGPDGHDLCNACGMYWYRYDLLRPLRRETPEPPSDDESDREHRGGSQHANASRRPIKTGSRHTPFSIEEDALIIKLKELDHLSWERIGNHFQGRSHYGVQCRYAKTLVSQPSAGRDALIEQGFEFDKDSEAEEALHEERNEQRDELLVQLRLEDELDWAAIAERIPGRTSAWVEKRFDILVGNRSPSSATARKKKKKKRANPIYANAPKHHYKVYTPEEDELLIKLREVDKLPWEILAQEFTQRTWLSLQKRYVRTLAQRHKAMRAGGDDPYTHVFLQADDDDDGDVQLGPPGRKRMEQMLAQRREEDETLLRLKNIEGLSFGEIAERMPGRTVASLINRYEQLREFNGSMGVPAPALPDEGTQEGESAGGEVRDQSTFMNTAAGPDEARSMKGSRYTPGECELIMRLRNDENLAWYAIAARLPGRTARGVEKHHCHLTQKSLSHPADVTVATEGFTETPPVMEDIGVSVIDPMLIGDAMNEGAAAVQASEPVAETLEASGATQSGTPPASPTDEASESTPNPCPTAMPILSNSLQQPHPDPPIEHSIIKTSAHYTGPAKPGAKWTQAEHELLVKLRSKKMSWVDIASELPGRTASAVACRWHEHWKDEDTIMASPVRAETTLRSVVSEDHTTLQFSCGASAPVSNTTPSRSTAMPSRPVSSPTLLYRTPPQPENSLQASAFDRSREYATPSETAAPLAPSASRSSPLTPLPPSSPIAAESPDYTSTPDREATPLPTSSPFTTALAPAFYDTPEKYTQRAMPYFVAPRANMISSLSGAAQHRQSTDPLIERSPGDGVISSAEKDSAALRADDGLPTVESAIGSEGAGVVISEETLELSAMPHLMQHPESASPDTTTIPLTSRLARNNTADSSMGVEPDVEDALPATDPPHAAPVTRKCIGVCRAIEPIAEFAGSRSRDPVLRCLDCRGLVLDTASGRARKRTSADKAVMMPPGLTQDSADEVGLTEGLNVAYLPPANDVRRRTRGQLRAERRASQRTLDASSSPKVGPPANSPLVDMPPLLAVPNKESRRSRTSKEAGPSGAQSSVPAAPNGFPLTTTSPPTINEMSASVPVPMDDAGPDFSETFQVDNGLGDDSVARLSTAPDMVSKTDIIPPSSTDSLQVNSPAEFKPLLTSLVDCKPILSSDILRDPESSPVKLHADSLVAEEKHTLDETKVVGAKEETPLVKPEHPTFVSRSSSPVFSCIKEQSPRAVYSRAVSAAYPGSLADRSKQSDLTGRRCASTPASSGGRARASTVGRAIGNVRKSMQMRAKVEDSSEDELAL